MVADGKILTELGTKEELSDKMEDWWLRDNLVASIKSDSAFLQAMMFSPKRANEVIGRMLADYKAVEERDKLKIMNREAVTDNILSTEDEMKAIYQHEEGEETPTQKVGRLLLWSRIKM